MQDDSQTDSFTGSAAQGLLFGPDKQGMRCCNASIYNQICIAEVKIVSEKAGRAYCQIHKTTRQLAVRWCLLCHTVSERCFRTWLWHLDTAAPRRAKTSMLLEADQLVTYSNFSGPYRSHLQLARLVMLQTALQIRPIDSLYSQEQG